MTTIEFGGVSGGDGFVVHDTEAAELVAAHKHDVLPVGFAPGGVEFAVESEAGERWVGGELADLGDAVEPEIVAGEVVVAVEQVTARKFLF